MRHLIKSTKKEKRVISSRIVNIVICASSPASKMPKTPAKPSYSLVGDLRLISRENNQPLGMLF